MASEIARLLDAPAKNRDPKKIFVPRLLLVDNAYSDQSGKRSVDLLLMSRAGSAGFAERFPGTDASYEARRFAHTVAFIGNGTDGFEQRRRHFFSDARLQLGQVLTEKEVFDLGYVEPHIDTVCGQIVRIVQRLISHDASRGLTEALRETGLIGQKHFAVLTPAPSQEQILNDFHPQSFADFPPTWENTLDIFDHEPRPSLSEPTGVCMSHLANLRLFALMDGELPVRIDYFEPKTATYCRFMTTAPPLEEA